jgi:hypothetical protein
MFLEIKPTTCSSALCCLQEFTRFVGVVMWYENKLVHCVVDLSKCDIGETEMMFHDNTIGSFSFPYNYILRVVELEEKNNMPSYLDVEKLLEDTSCSTFYMFVSY